MDDEGEADNSVCNKLLLDPLPAACDMDEESDECEDDAGCEVIEVEDGEVRTEYVDDVNADAAEDAAVDEDVGEEDGNAEAC